MRKLLRIISNLFKSKQAVELPKQSNTTDILQAATTELVSRPQQIKEDRFFKRANNIIDEFQYEHPKIITPMGEYYGVNDPRNTYDIDKVHEMEDYDGSKIYVGGAGNTTLEVNSVLDREPDDMPDNQEQMEYINALREKWKKREMLVNYIDHVKQYPMTPQEAFSKPDKSTDNEQK